MEYFSDKPITSKEKDLLGTSYFADSFAQTIYNYKNQDSLVLALYGKWGSGKTSIINMVLGKLDELYNNSNNKPIILKFNPWNYSDKNDLIRKFFNELKLKINSSGDDKHLKNIGKSIEYYIAALDFVSVIPVIGNPLSSSLKFLLTSKIKKLKKVESLESTRENLENNLKKAKKKIIIIIDDIDRSTNIQIRQIFQLIKKVADLPNTIYLLAMDKEIVSKALSEVQNIDGNEYLEKIIQVPFEIPKIRESSIYDIFLSKLNKIVYYINPSISVDSEYWSEVLENCINPYINNLRDVNRVLNVFSFRYSSLYEETSFEDMLAMCTIEVLQPELYKWIGNNKENLCGGVSCLVFSTADNPNDNYNKVYKEFEELEINPDLAINFVSTLFPSFSRKINKNFHGFTDDKRLREKMRLASIDRFETYYMFDLINIKVPRSVIRKCLYDFDELKLKEIIKRINHEGNINYFLREIEASIDFVPYNRLNVIAKALLSLEGQFKYEDNFLSEGRIYAITEDIIINILKKLKNIDERYTIISSTLELAGKLEIGSVAAIINFAENSYNKSQNNRDIKENIFLDLEHLEKLKNNFVEKVKSLSRKESLFEAPQFKLLIYLWEKFDDKSFNNYIKGILNNKFTTLKFICSLANRWYGINSRGWKIYEEYYSRFISRETVYKLIKDLNKDDIKEFTKTQQLKLVQFVLNYEKNDRGGITDKCAMEYLDKLKES